MDRVIETFSGEWWLYTFLASAVIFGILQFFKNKSDRTKKLAGKVIGSCALLLLLIWQIHFIYTGTWTAGVSLPFHLCGISKVVGAILLFKYNQRWFEFAVLLGAGGALQAFMTPQLEIDRSTFAIFEYYFSHGSIILMPLYLFYVLDHRVRERSWIYTFILGIGVLSLVGVINYFVKGNYIYLCEKPLVDNPLLIGPWPYYLSGFLVFGFINIILFYFLFRWWGNRLDKAKNNFIEAT